MARLKAPAAPPKARSTKLRRIGQALFACVLFAALGGGWAYHRARAQVSESLMDLGAQMMMLAGARNQDAPRDLMLNGQVIRFSSGTADRRASEVLDTFEERCGAVDGNLPEQLEAMRAQHGAPPPEGRTSPVLREDDGRRGYVACMDLRQSIGVTDLARRIARFGETGDVADIGDMRFVFVEELEREGRASTHFVAMWTQGSFDLGRMFPERGDAPGRDIDGVERPEGARRTISGWERGQPYAISIYETREDEANLAHFYRRTLEWNGWTVLEAADRQAPQDAPRTLVAERGERMVTVVLATDPRTGMASAAVIDAR